MYLDGFLLPIPKQYLDEYMAVAQQVAEIWKEHGAKDYHEFVGDDLHLQGTRSFADAVVLKEDEVVIFGWAVFASKEDRDRANRSVPKDPRMSELVKPLTNSERLIFDAGRMFYAGFKALV